jgi:hypothetical protein
MCTQHVTFVPYSVLQNFLSLCYQQLIPKVRKGNPRQKDSTDLMTSSCQVIPYGVVTSTLTVLNKGRALAGIPVTRDFQSFVSRKRQPCLGSRNVTQWSVGIRGSPSAIPRCVWRQSNYDFPPCPVPKLRCVDIQTQSERDRLWGLQAYGILRSTEW